MTTSCQDVDLALARVRELGFGVRPDERGRPFSQNDARSRPFRNAESRAIDLVRHAPASLEPFLVQRLRESYALAQRTPGEETVCRVLVTGLGDRRSVLAAPIMCRIFVDRFGSGFLRDEILTAIHPGYGRRRILFTLRLALRDTDEVIRATAVTQLEIVCGQAALPEVTGCIVDPAENVRSALVHVLGKLRTPAAIHLLAVLGECDPAVHGPAMHELGLFFFRPAGTAVPPPAVRAALRSTAEVRRAAAVALIGGYQHTTPDLLRCAGDPSRLVRLTLTHALRSQAAAGSMEAVFALRALREHDRDERVRSWAADKVARLRSDLRRGDMQTALLWDDDRHPGRAVAPS